MNLPYIRTAEFSKKFRSLTYFDSRNTTICVNCDSMKRARLIVDLSGVDQKLTETQS